MPALARIFRCIAVALAFGAAAAQVEAAAPKQFFKPHQITKAKASPLERAPGVISVVRPVEFNAAEMLDLRPGDEIELALPSAAARTVVFERAQSHGGGVHSWVGYFKERGRNNRVMITSGPNGSYGVIDTPEGSFRIIPGNGHDWLVDMTEEQRHIPASPIEDDGRMPPPEEKVFVAGDNRPTFEDPRFSSNGGIAKVAPTPQVVMDMMVVVTRTLADRLGPNLMTRLYFLIMRANQAYTDSEVATTLRLVKLSVVDYPDDTDNGNALDDITPVGVGGMGVFTGIEAQRAAAGGDLVAFMRNGSSFGGSGVAWVGSTAPNPLRMYSVTTGCVLGCETVFIHEVGHNMGNKHDRYTNAFQGSQSGGAFPYSFGYVYCHSGGRSCEPNIVANNQGTCAAEPECATASSNNFRDIMAYFPSSTTELPRFSNGALANCAAPAGDGVPRACGISSGASDSADTALSMNGTRIVMSGLRAQVSAAQMPGSLQFTQVAYSGTEAGGTVTFTVSRMRDSTIVGGGGAVSVGYTLTAATATAGSDFVVAAGTLNWADADFANKTFPVTLTSDMVPEDVETFTATLSNPAGAAGVFIGHPSSALGVISDLWPPNGAAIPSWTTPTGVAWAVPAVNPLTDPSYDGDGASLKSGAIFNCPPTCSFPAVPAASSTQFVGNFISGTVAFAYRVNSYPNNGFFEFLVDGVVRLSDSGDGGWKFFTMPITAGVHTLQWRYRPTLTFACRNAIPAPPQGINCADRAWIDTVSLPLGAPLPNPPRLSNISTRMQVLTGNDVMIGGFVIGGSVNKTVVVRARGPSLVPFGIANALPNPFVQLVRSSDQAPIASNDNWGTAANAAAIAASGFAPSNGLESAILMSLPPGAYTAIVSGATPATGVGIIEVFEVDEPATPLANISTRGQVRTGNDVMIGGFVVQGTGPQTVVVRARGPSLIPFGITNALANPSLQLVRSSDQFTMATNDNWNLALNAAAITASGFAPSDNLEAAILITLDPGAYTAIVSGVGGGTGVGIVEVFTTP